MGFWVSVRSSATQNDTALLLIAALGVPMGPKSLGGSDCLFPDPGIGAPQNQNPQNQDPISLPVTGPVVSTKMGAHEGSPQKDAQEVSREAAGKLSTQRGDVPQCQTCPSTTGALRFGSALRAPFFPHATLLPDQPLAPSPYLPAVGIQSTNHLLHKSSSCWAPVLISPHLFLNT